MKVLVSFANQHQWWEVEWCGGFFLSLSSFFLSSLTNATVCIVGTCAVTVVKRTVLEGGKYCPRRSMADCWVREWRHEGWLCLVGERAHRLVCAQWHPHEEDKSSREVVSSFYVVCNGCGIFFLFPLLQYCLFSRCCCCSPKIFLFWRRGQRTRSASRGSCTARFIITLLRQNKCIFQWQQLQRHDFLFNYTWRD